MNPLEATVVGLFVIVVFIMGVSIGLEMLKRQVHTGIAYTAPGVLAALLIYTFLALIEVTG